MQLGGMAAMILSGESQRAIDVGGGGGAGATDDVHGCHKAARVFCASRLVAQERGTREREREEEEERCGSLLLSIFHRCSYC